MERALSLWLPWALCGDPGNRPPLTQPVNVYPQPPVRANTVLPRRELTAGSRLREAVVRVSATKEGANRR